MDKQQIETEVSSKKLNRRALYRYNREVIKMSRPNAAIAAGYSKALANRRKTSTDAVDFPSLFEQAGFSNKIKVNKIMAGMEATKVFYDEGGVRHEEPDWTIRHKHLETALKLCKDLTNSDKNTTNLMIITTLAERIKAARERNDARIRINSGLQRNRIETVDISGEEFRVTEKE